MKNVVIFGNPKDPHVNKVAEKIINFGCNVGIYTPISAYRLAEDPLSFSMYDSDTSIEISSFDDPETLINIKYGNAVFWIRNKFFNIGFFKESDRINYFESQTRETFIFGIAKLLDAHIINDEYYNSNNCNKINQLKVAKHIGFEIPKTIVTSDKNKIISFLRKNQNSIIKPLGISYVYPIYDIDNKKSVIQYH